MFACFAISSQFLLRNWVSGSNAVFFISCKKTPSFSKIETPEKKPKNFLGGFFKDQRTHDMVVACSGAGVS
jgi:hypothetical protein